MRAKQHSEIAEGFEVLRPSEMLLDADQVFDREHRQIRRADPHHHRAWANRGEVAERRDLREQVEVEVTSGESEILELREQRRIDPDLDSSAGHSKPRIELTQDLGESLAIDASAVVAEIDVERHPGTAMQGFGLTSDHHEVDASLEKPLRDPLEVRAFRGVGHSRSFRCRRRRETRWSRLMRSVGVN